MQPELALKAISHTVIAIFLVTLLFVLLISLRKEINGDAPLRGLFHLGLVVMGFCTFIALMAAYFHASKMIVPESISQRIDTAVVSQPAGTT
jgi:drug/metabolite transporter (DMT)-like permease